MADSYLTTVVFLDPRQVHTIRQKLQVLLLLPYTQPDVYESVITLVRDLNAIFENAYNLPTLANTNAAPEI